MLLLPPLKLQKAPTTYAGWHTNMMDMERKALIFRKLRCVQSGSKIEFMNLVVSIVAFLPALQIAYPYLPVLLCTLGAHTGLSLTRCLSQKHFVSVGACMDSCWHQYYNPVMHMQVMSLHICIY